MEYPRTNFWRRTAMAALALGATALFAGIAQTGYIGILGGGPVYMHNLTNIKELKKAGFTELLVWSVEVKANGDLESQRRISADLERTIYRRPDTGPISRATCSTIKTGKVTRITFSIGSSNYRRFPEPEGAGGFRKGPARRASSTRISPRLPRRCRSMRSISTTRTATTANPRSSSR